MPNPRDVRVTAAQLYLLPVETRVPLKFGTETLTSVTCARVRVTVESEDGRTAEGWGETPISVQWVWPSGLPYSTRHERLLDLCRRLAKAFIGDEQGHPMELGYQFQETRLSQVLDEANQDSGEEPIPHLAALVCLSAYDIALHDAYGNLHQKDVYATYTEPFLNKDLSHFLEPAAGSDCSFVDRYPSDFFVEPSSPRIPAWHLVGGLDLLTPDQAKGDEPNDGYPVFLTEWIARDQLTCLKIKLRGNDAEWDYQRIVAVGDLAGAGGVQWLTTDFNCTVTDPDYVNALLDQLRDDHPRIYGMVLYVEQPFPYDLEEFRIDAHSVSSRKPLFLDESAHDWKFVRLGRELGWTGVALKTCKTQTGALLSACWAKAHGMTLMVQDLTNPMLAQIPHVRLAVHTGTIMGVETNGMQFYPEASLPEAAVHPGLYQRRNGSLDFSTISGSGFGYRLDEITRTLPDPE